MKEVEVRAIFTLAAVPVQEVYQIENGYWPEAYADLRKANPWWLVKTPTGLVRIGRRKRVITIDWSDTPFRGIVTDDDVTKETYMVYACTLGNAVDYLSTWRRRAMP